MNLTWRRVAVWFGVLALADALLLVAPVGLPVDPVAGVVPRAAVPLLALVAAGYGLRVLLDGAGESTAREPPATADPDEDGVDLVGADIDAAYDALADDDESTWTRRNAERMLRAELRRAGRTALEWRGHDRETAERLLDEGAWTDDPRAAAFLGDAHLPLRLRVRDWVSGQGRRRRAEAAVGELSTLLDDGGDADGAEPAWPPRHGTDPAAAAVLEAAARDPAGSSGTAELDPEVDA